MQFLACAHGRSLAKAAQQKLYKQLSYPCKFQKCHCANASVSFGCFCLRTPGKFQGCVLNVSEFFEIFLAMALQLPQHFSHACHRQGSHASWQACAGHHTTLAALPTPPPTPLMLHWQQFSLLSPEFHIGCRLRFY